VLIQCSDDCCRKFATAAFAPPVSSGACGYGSGIETDELWPYTASLISLSSFDLFTGNCGQCVEVTCTGAVPNI